MRNTTMASDASGGSLSWDKLHGIKYLLGLMLCITGLSLTVIAAPADLDPAFGSGGKALWSPIGNSRSGAGMALQADGKIVMVGGGTESSGTSAFMVVRFYADGSIDPTFGAGGVTTISFGGTSELSISVDIQPDGKIVALGRTNFGNNTDVAIARLNSDGLLDSTFSGDGKVTVGFNDQAGNQPDFASVVKVAANGKIVFAGGSGPGTNIQYYAHVGRLNTDGSLDTAFDSDGKVLSGLGSGIWADMVANADGTIYVTGTASTQFSSTVKVTKYDENGAAAWTFTRAIGLPPGCYMKLNGIATQTDGKIVVVGSNTCRAAAIRLNSNGTEDSSFVSPIVPGTLEAYSMAIQADGKILATVGFEPNNGDAFSLVRYNTDGSLDSGFGTAGIARIQVINGWEIGRDIVIQPDGKILVGGPASNSIGSGHHFAMVRYMGEASVPSTPLFDYDGDGRADISVFRPSENRWYILRSSDQGLTSHLFAISGDVAVPADYDGDGRTEVGVFRPSSGDWWYLSSINGSQIYTHWGQAGDIPRPSDFDGDGKTDFVVYRPSNSAWYRLSATGQTSVINFGIAEDKPLAGDFDGDGKSDVAIYRPSTGDWWYAASSAGEQHRVTHWGVSTDIPVPADYDGDGKTDLAVYRPSQGVWYISNSGGASPTVIGFGLAEDKPVSADYDGDGRADIAVFRPSTGVWYLLQTTGGFGAMQWGISSDLPTPNAFVP